MASPYLNEKAARLKQEAELNAGIGASGPVDCCQTAAPREVPPRESLLNWIRAIESDLVRQLTRLQQAREVIEWASDDTLRIVKQLVELDFQRRF